MKKILFIFLISIVSLFGFMFEKTNVENNKIEEFKNGSLYCIKGYYFIKATCCESSFTQIMENINGKNLPMKCKIKKDK